MLSERSLATACGGGFNSIDKQLRGVVGGNLVDVVPTSSAATAAAFFYLDKLRNDDKLSTLLTAAAAASASVSSEMQIDSSKDIINMESNTIKGNNDKNSGKINEHNNSNNSNSNIGSSLMTNQVRSALSGCANTIPNVSSMDINQQNHNKHQHQLQLGTVKMPQIAQNQNQKNNFSSTGGVKKERLSPSTNGDILSTTSRSRSTTPSTFRGTSPQQQISTEALIPLSSLLRIQQVQATNDSQNSSANAATMDATNLLTATVSAPKDYSTRNYSDIMRSLAAKYNDAGNINPPSGRRNPFFEMPLATPPAAAGHKNVNQMNANRSATMITTTPTTAAPLCKKGDEQQSHLLPQLSMSPSEVAVAAAAASFLSSLPFSQNVCPPLIDMSSTQALLTLARAAKEAEIHAILQSTQPIPKSLKSSPHPSLSVALQQASQYVSSAFYSAQLQQQQQTQSTNQSSPRPTGKTASNCSNGTTTNASNSKMPTNAVTTTVPLDLSSQPPSAKRCKVESSTTTVNSKAREEHKPKSTAFHVTEKAEFVGRGISTGSRSSTPENAIELKDSTALTAIRGPPPMAQQCQAHSEEVARWSVDDVCAFIGQIDICADYVQHFRDQCIDGSGLPLLTEEHLLNSLGMKLGPALKLRSLLAKKLGGPCPCVACISQARQRLAFQEVTKSAVVKSIPAATTELLLAPSITTAHAKEESADVPNVTTEACDKLLHCLKERQCDDEKKQQQVRESEKSEQPCLNSNKDNDSCAALTLQIRANLYKNETNNNNPNNNENLSSKNNNRNLSKIANEASAKNSADSDLDPAHNSAKSEDCKNNSSNFGNSSSTKNGNLQRTGSGDIADVGS